MAEKAFRAALGGSIRAAREAAGLTQRQVAEKAGVADKYLSRIEVGAVMPSIHIVVRLARALGTGVDALVGSSVPHHAAALGAVARLLRGRSKQEADRVVRVVREMLR